VKIINKKSYSISINIFSLIITFNKSIKALNYEKNKLINNRQIIIFSINNSNNSIVNNSDNSLINNIVYNNSSVLNNVFIFHLGGRPHNFNLREWKDLCNCQIKSGNSSDTPFLVVTADLLNYIISIASGRQRSLFNKYKTNHTMSVNAEITVKQASRDQ